MRQNDLARELAELKRRLAGVERAHSLKRSPIYQGPPTLAPDRLTVGVVGNLVQDPGFKTAIRSPLPAGWATVPDTVLIGDLIKTYPEFNFLRHQPVGSLTEFFVGDSYALDGDAGNYLAENDDLFQLEPTTSGVQFDAGDTMLQEGEGSGQLLTEDEAGGFQLEPEVAVSGLPSQAAEESSLFLTDFVVVDSGRTLRIACQVRRDMDSLTTTWQPVEARVRAIFYKDDKTTAVTESFNLVLADDTVVGEWTPLQNTFLVPEGYTYARAVLSTAYQQQGSVDFIKPEVQLLWNRVQSDTFAQGTAGWLLDNETSQMQNVAVVEDLGADIVSARQIFMDGIDLSSESVNTLAKGVIAYDEKTSGTVTDEITTTETKLFEFSAGQMYTGRLYRIVAIGFLNATDPYTRYTMRMRYTLDGSSPSVSSASLRSHDYEMDSNTTAAFHYSRCFDIDSDTENFRVGLYLLKATGLGTAHISFSRALEMYVEDLGSFESAAAAGTLSQKSYADATPPDADPVRTFTKTWHSTWTRSFEGDGSPEGNEDCYQGYYSSSQGNQRSLAGFDYSSIQAALAGATIQSVKLTFRMKHTWAYAGATVRIGTHDYTSEPGSWSDSRVDQAQHSFSGCKEGSTYTKTLSNSIGNDFKSGAAKGISFGPGASNSSSSYYCYMYGGAVSSSRPRLTITYTK